jgi:hypothetical protein
MTGRAARSAPACRPSGALAASSDAPWESQSDAFAESASVASARAEPASACRIDAIPSSVRSMCGRISA